MNTSKIEQMFAKFEAELLVEKGKGKIKLLKKKIRHFKKLKKNPLFDLPNFDKTF